MTRKVVSIKPGTHRVMQLARVKGSWPSDQLFVDFLLQAGIELNLTPVLMGRLRGAASEAGVPMSVFLTMVLSLYESQESA